MSESNQESTIKNSSDVSFMKALFDFKFEEWVTLRIASVIYVLFIVLVSLIAVGLVVTWLVAGFSSGEGALTVLALGAIALGWFLSILLYRLVIESAIATIKVAENTASLRK